MKRFHQFVLILQLLLLPLHSLAQERPKLTPIPPGEDRIEPLGQGQPAPFSGQIFEPKTALRWGNYIEQCRDRWMLDVEAQKKLNAVNEVFWKEQLERTRAFDQTIFQQQQQQISQLQSALNNRPWYQSPWTGLVAGLVLAGGLVIGGVALQR